MLQRSLSFINIPSYSEDTYVVGNANREVFHWLNGYAEWPPYIRGGLLYGEQGSGKTHLCHVIKAHHSDGVMLNGRAYSGHHPFDVTGGFFIIDDADCASSEWLFHLYNHASQNAIPVFLTMTSPLSAWCFLPDLMSRLKTLAPFELSWPDEGMMHALLCKKFYDMGLVVHTDVLTYLAQRIDRSYPSINAWVTHLDRLSAEYKRKITIPFIKEMCSEM